MATSCAGLDKLGNAAQPRPDNPTKYPELVHQSERLQVWYKQDTTFAVPKSAIMVQISR